MESPSNASSSQSSAAAYSLTPEREVELTEEARQIPDRELLFFPGKLARRVAWSARIQAAAERDAGDLVRTPFADEEPPLTLAEIKGQRDRLELLRRSQSRWTAVSHGQKLASAQFEAAALEAAGHRQALLRFFDLRARNNPELQRRLSAIRAGDGDADLVQDVSDLLLLCEEHEAAVDAAPRGEGAAADRLAELSPMLVRLLADKTLSPEMQQARRLRDAAYTMVIRTERRLRDAAEYWYGGTDRMKEYAAYASSAGGRGAEVEEDEGEAPEVASPVAAPA